MIGEVPQGRGQLPGGQIEGDTKGGRGARVWVSEQRSAHIVP